MRKKKMFRELKGGDWFTYRSALYLKIGPLSVCKLSRKYGKFNVNLFNGSKVSIRPANFHHRSLVIPVSVSIGIS